MGAVSLQVLLLTSLIGACQCNILFLILDQPGQYHLSKARQLERSITEESFKLELKVKVLRLTVHFPDVIGAWAVWPIIGRLTKYMDQISADWLFICEDETLVNVVRLQYMLKRFDIKENKGWFLGHALRDRQPTIIHHYAFLNDPSSFGYPDFGSGLAISVQLLKKLVEQITRTDFNTGFSIDAKHELSMLVWNSGNGTRLTDVPELCSHINSSDRCASGFHSSNDECRQNTMIRQELKLGVKTCSKFHEKRILIVKQTWSRGFESIIQYYSDTEDLTIPTVNIGLQNTERGHCGKTMEILKKMLLDNSAGKNSWLGIVDDDTLISIPRLKKLLNCYDPSQMLILGERYGYGFNVHGTSGYDYPTGGSGMFFTTSAAQSIISNCNCPSLDSPDDMILGMCASYLNITLVHSATLHQARPDDYASDYLTRQKPVSFHKHYEIDPVAVYNHYLLEDENLDQDKNLVREEL